MESIKEILNETFSEILKTDRTKAIRAFELLIKLFQNILNNPSEPKFRNFKKTNKLIQSEILIFPNIIDSLYIMGYVEDKDDENILLYQADSLENFIIAIEILKKLSEGVPVKVFQYDLTNGLAKQFGRMLIGKNVEGVWHTAVCVYQKEYFYGGGICIGEPKKTPYGYPVREIDMGTTNVSREDFETFLKVIVKDFTQQNYDLLKHNCNHFTDSALMFLTGKHLPDSILNQHEQLLNTPMGQMIKPYLENMSKQNNSFLPDMFEGR